MDIVNSSYNNIMVVWFVFLSLSVLSAASAIECPDGWIYIGQSSNGICIKRFTTQLSYKEAKLACRDHSAFLVNLDLQIVSQLLTTDSLSAQKQQVFTEGSYFWTGLHHDGETFAWDGTLPSTPKLNLFCDNYGEMTVIDREKGSGWSCDNLPTADIPVKETCVAAHLAAVDAAVSPSSKLRNVTVAMLSAQRCDVRNEYICAAANIGRFNASLISRESNSNQSRPRISYDVSTNSLQCSYDAEERPHAFLKPTGEITAKVILDHPLSYNQGGLYKCVVWVKEIADYVYSESLDMTKDGQLHYFTVSLPLVNEYTAEWHENLVALYPTLNSFPPYHPFTLLPLIIQVTNLLQTALGYAIEDITSYVDCSDCIDSSRFHSFKLDVLRLSSLRPNADPDGMLVSTEAVLHIEDTGSGDDKEKLSVSRQLLLHYFKSNLQQLLRLNSNQSKAIHISTVSAPSHMEALNFSVNCLPELKYITELNRTVQLPKAALEQTIPVSTCKTGVEYSLNMSCTASQSHLPLWEISDVQLCRHSDVTMATDLIDILQNLDITDSGSAISALHQLANQLALSAASQLTFSAADLSLLVDLMTQLTKVELKDKKQLQQFFSLFVTVMDHVLSAREDNTTVPTNKTNDIKTRGRILLALNSLQYMKLPPDVTPTEGDVFTQSSANIGVKLTVSNETAEEMSVYAEDGNIRIQYTNNSSNATNKKESSLHLALSPETNPERESIRTFTMIFRNNELYRSFDKSVRPAGLIASVSLSTFTGSPVSISDTDNAIRLRFTDLRHRFNQSMLFCGYWEEKEYEWSGRGCSKSREINGTVVCSCNHLTAFSVIMSRIQVDDLTANALSIISRVGLSVSCFSLLLVLFTAALYKNLRKHNSQKVLICLSTSLLALNLTFLLGVDKTRNPISCTVVAILIHYFLLTSFAWMLVEAVLQYLRFVKVLGTYIPRFIIKAVLPAFGVPATVVGITMAVDLRFYGNQYDKICWIDGNVAYYAVIAPLSIVLTINIIIFVMVIHGMVTSENRLKKHRTVRSERSTVLLNLQVAIATFVILGLTWLFGFLTFIPEANRVFQYIFCILNSLQGLLIFIFHNIKEKTVQSAWESTFHSIASKSKFSRRSSASSTKSLPNRKLSAGSNNRRSSSKGGQCDGPHNVTLLRTDAVKESSLGNSVDQLENLDNLSNDVV